jgi:hypothetical protein
VISCLQRLSPIGGRMTATMIERTAYRNNCRKSLRCPAGSVRGAGEEAPDTCACMHIRRDAPSPHAGDDTGSHLLWLGVPTGIIGPELPIAHRKRTGNNEPSSGS